MKYLKPEMSVLILEAEHVIRTSLTKGTAEEVEKLPDDWSVSSGSN